MRQKSQHFLLATVLRKFTLNTKFKGDDMFVKRFKFMSFAMIFAISLILTGCDGLMTEQSDSKASEDTSNTASAQSTSVITGKVTLDESSVLNSEGRSGKMSAAAVSLNTHAVKAVNLTDNTVYTVNTSTSGEYILTGLTEGKYQLTAENSKYAKAYSTTLSLGRGTQATVNVTLQALATVIGYAPGADAVSIWGTNINALAFSSNSGRFELSGVPMGSMWLKIHIRDRYVDGWDYAYRIIHITQPGTTILDNTSSENDPASWNFKDLQVEDAWTESDTTLGLLIFGLGVEFTQQVTREELAAHVELLDSEGVSIPFQISQDGENDAKDLPESATWWTIQPSFANFEIPDLTNFSTVTLTIKAGLKSTYGNDLDTDFSRVVDWLDKRVYAIQGGWGDSENITYFFPEPLDASTDLSGIIVEDTSGDVPLENLHAAFESPSNGHIIIMQGDFRPGREYRVDLGTIDDAFATTSDGYAKLTFYNHRGWYENYLAFDDPDVHLFQTETAYIADMAPINGAQAVLTDSDVSVLFGGGTALNTGSLEITITPDGGSPLTYNSNQFSYYGMALDDDDHCDWNDFLDMEICRQQLRGITIKDYPFDYNKQYTIVVTGEDAYGTPLIQTSVFNTLTPAITEFQPTSSLVDPLQWAKWDGLYRVDFNTSMDITSGTLSVRDLSTDTDIPVMCGFGYYQEWSDSFENDRPDRYNCHPEEVLPGAHYEITLSGFKAQGATTDLPDAVYQYIAPPKAIYNASVTNGEIIEPEFATHQVSFDIFGVLTDTEKADIEAKLKVTSIGLDISTDVNHPEPKIFFFNNERGWGTRMIVAFTMDENRSYEIGLYAEDGSGNYAHLTGIMSPTSLISFVVAKASQTSIASFELIDWFGIEARVDINGGSEGVYTSSYFNGRLKIPLFMDPDAEWGNSQCNSSNTGDYYLSDSDILAALTLLDADGNPLTSMINVHGMGTDNHKYYTDWTWNNTTEQNEIWCVLEVYFSGHSKVDYDTNYTLLMDASSLAVDDTPVTKTMISSSFKTQPKGVFKLSVNSYNQNAPLQLTLQSNVLLDVADIHQFFSLGEDVNIVTVEEPWGFWDISDASGDMVAYSNNFMIVVDRPIYAVLEYNLGTLGDAGVGSWDIASDAEGELFFTSPQPGYLEVIPDLTPMALKANSVDSSGDLNGAVLVKFSRLADRTDFEDSTGDVTPATLPIVLVDATGDAISLASVGVTYNTVGIMADRWSETPFTSIEGIEAVLITPTTPLDPGSSYRVELGSGKQVKSLGGVQVLPTGYSENVGLTSPPEVVVTNDSNWDFLSTTVYDDFDSSQLNGFKWNPRLSGSESDMFIQSGSLMLSGERTIADTARMYARISVNDAVKDQAGAQGIETVVTFEDSSGDASQNRVVLDIGLYNMGARQPNSELGEIDAYISLYADGHGWMGVGRCDDSICDAWAAIWETEISIADPMNTAHTLAIGFDGTNVHLRLDGIETSVKMTDLYPVGTPGWKWMILKSEAKETGFMQAKVESVNIGHFDTSTFDMPLGTMGTEWSFDATTDFEDFSSGNVSTDKFIVWADNTDSTWDVVDGVFIATADKNISESTKGRITLDLVSSIRSQPTFQGLQADVTIDSITGDPSQQYVAVHGAIYKSTLGDIETAISIDGDGKVGFYAEMCTTDSCDDYINIFGKSFWIDNPLQTTHTIALGFDGTNVLYKVDNKTASYPITQGYPVVSAGWDNWAGIRAAQVNQDTESGTMVVHVDNIVIGGNVDFNSGDSIVGTWEINNEYSTFIALEDGHFFWIEVTEENPLFGEAGEPERRENGIEYGTYTYDPAGNSFIYNGIVDISGVYDATPDTDAAYCAGCLLDEDGDITTESTLAMDVYDDTLNLLFIGDGVEVPRILKSTSGSIVGTWIRKADDTHYLLVLFEDGKFIYAEPEGTAPNGYEFGGYSFDGSDISFTAEIDNIDADGSGTGGFLDGTNTATAAVSGDELTIAGTLVFTRQ
jgi:hypothetical protein